MDEPAVDHAIRGGGSTQQAVQVFEIAAMRLGAGVDKSLGARLRASETERLMARVNQFLYYGRADKSCGAGDEYAHRDFSVTSFRDRVRGPVVVRLGDRENTIYAVKSVLSSQSSGTTHGPAVRRAFAAKAPQLFGRRLRCRDGFKLIGAGGLLLAWRRESGSPATAILPWLTGAAGGAAERPITFNGAGVPRAWRLRLRHLLPEEAFYGLVQSPLLKTALAIVQPPPPQRLFSPRRAPRVCR
jgi:hypothetical protein